MRCPSCSSENPDEKKFCGECGSPLVLRCASCGAENPPRFKFCGDCGASLPTQSSSPPVQSSEFRVLSSKDEDRRPGPHNVPPLSQDSALRTQHSDGERRQLTVMFCDLVGSTALSEQLDPEELREVVQAYQETCAKVINRFEGHIAQHLGDGLLVYFSYPNAHEDDAARAVRAGLEIIAALHIKVPTPMVEQASSLLAARMAAPPEGQEEGDIGKERELQVRIGIHTGLVVIGEIGSGEKREILALGETPNLAARLQALAEPNTLVISAATQRLVHGLFECQDLGPQTLKGISAPLSVYRVIGESVAQSRFEVSVRTGLTPLVGREEELALLQRRWEQTKAGEGQVVLLSGEPGIGKSRLVDALKEHARQEGAITIEFRCSPYYQNSALHPIIEHLQRLLRFERDDSPEEKLHKLTVGTRRAVPLQSDTIPLLAALLSLPNPEGYPPLTFSPQKQKERTLIALVNWLVEETKRAPLYCAWEDLHWADPSTLEVLNLLLDQAPTTRLLTLLTFRPEFTPPWRLRAHITQLTLNRLGKQQVREMVKLIVTQTLRPSTSSGRTGSKSSGESLAVRAESFDRLRTGSVEARLTLSEELLDTLIARTDGVPLFVEELTKTVMESVGSIGSASTSHRATPHLEIPATLQDSLMARLDRLGPAKAVAQLGATLGREFSYELLQTVSLLNDETLQPGLRQLVDAELMYQRGLPPQASYIFKHALIQDTAYQSLLKSTRQQYHQQIAHVLGERFPDTKETQPELLAHHYTEAGLIAQAVPYWQQAGERATQRSANVEAVSHLTKGLEVLKALPDTPERVQQELMLQIALGVPLILTKGHAAPEVETTYARALELCQQVGETPQLFSVLVGLRRFYFVRGQLQTAHELGEQLLRLAQSVQDPGLLAWAHVMLGEALLCLGEFVMAREHLEQGIALYDSKQHRSLAFLYGNDTGVACLSRVAQALWFLGYPDQALKRGHEALALAQKLPHPFSLAFALYFAALVHQYRRERQAAQDRAEAAIALASEQGFPALLAPGTMLRGWTLVKQERREEGIEQMRHRLAASQATGTGLTRPYHLALLAEAYGERGQTEEGLAVLAEALAVVGKTGERLYEAELYRLKGELLLMQEGKKKN